MAKNKSQFSARDSLKGYLFQCKIALLLSLQKMKDGSKFDIVIEAEDDVVIKKDNQVIESSQIKHTSKDEADVGDYSTNLWKTIRIWCDGISKGYFSSETKFFLITTGVIPSDCAAHCLKENNRDIFKVIDTLSKVSKTSKNESNQKAYKLFNSMTYNEKQELFENVVIIDKNPIIEDIDVEICKEISNAAREHLLGSFRKRFVGWWLNRVFDHINDENDLIKSQEIRAKMDILRDQFSKYNLPIDNDILDFEVNESEFDDYIFVKQLKLVDMNNGIFRAVKNYYRAFEHRSRWLQEGFVLPEELDRYEKQLIEEWEICFERIQDKIGDSKADEDKIKYGKALYRWAETKFVPLRPNITEAFVTRGSYQILSNEKKIGWHPEFEKKLQDIIIGES
ncbi:MAG: hypothetical protein Q7U35_05635 [Methanobacteriaceae archaeon]|nr:hypothetical protein [Methanobacteriaceae archaeon]MDP2835395.1 hypothetical protein [Methanobacteriaceae archaeon]MDP3035041.1 hypothetical protein [Methanobacteriaceae archaeon]MDP3486042.1 hypothetical protein [Methanobacteriaceae archaeon]MDP3623641.1 hypothetical protein [Methanobacteriaceae archaeon]